MKRGLKRVLKILLLVVGLLAAGVGGVILSIIIGKASIVDAARVDGVEIVKDGFVSAAIVELGPRAVALVDAGNDEHGAALLSALRRRGLDAEAVKLVLLTHGDTDHVAGAPLFLRAKIMALGSDVALAEGRAARGVRSARPTGVKIVRALADGDVIDVDAAGTVSVGRGGSPPPSTATRFEVFAIPGHTPGSAAYLARGVLFLGDSAEITTDGGLAPSTWLFCSDRPLNRRSLRELAARLAPRAPSIKAIACSHSGVSTRGIAPLSELAPRLAP
jgi:glyoxylase-like metal-dependent hydrolase (beta-lactamase superfamily II)